MMGERPFRRQRALFALVLGCCGYLACGSSAVMAEPTANDAPRTEDLIPQDDVIFRNEASADELPITYSLQIYKEPSRIKLKGNMSSQEDYKTLMGLVKANFPAVDLNNRVKINDKAAKEDVKIGGLSFALKLLGYVETGRASVDNNGLSLQGETSTAVVLTEVNKLIENDKPTGMPMNIHIARPERNWQASVSADGVVKISGIVKSDEVRQNILEVINSRFPRFRLEDRTLVNKSISDAWESVSLRSVELLSLLEKGSVEVTEQTIHLKGDASNGKALLMIDAVGAKLPSGFALRSEVTAPAPPHAGIAAVPVLGATMSR